MTTTQVTQPIEIQPVVGDGRLKDTTPGSRLQPEPPCDKKKVTYDLESSNACAFLENTDHACAHDVAIARCDCLMARYLKWKLENRIRSNLAQAVVIVLSALTPVVLLFPGLASDPARIIGAGLSALAAIAAGALGHFAWRDQYIRYGYTFHALQYEKYTYLTGATKNYAYSDSELNARRFARRVEEIAISEVTDWRNLMEKMSDVDEDPPNGRGSANGQAGRPAAKRE